MASTVVGVFKNNTKAHEAIREMLVSGFHRDQISVFSPHVSDPSTDPSRTTLSDELKQEAGMDDLFRSLASMFTDYDELTVYSDVTRQGQVVLSVYADNDERVDQAIELMNHHSPVDVSEQLFGSGRSASLWGSLDTATVPEEELRRIKEQDRKRSVRRAGNLRIYPYASARMDEGGADAGGAPDR